MVKYIPKKIIDDDICIKNIKKQIIGYELCKNNIKEAKQAIKQCIDIIKIDNTYNNTFLLNVFMSFSLVKYVACFNEGAWFQLSDKIYEDDKNILKNDKELTARDFHKLLKNYRNEHIAHSGDMLNIGEIGAIRKADEIAILTIVAPRVESKEIFYNQFNKLCDICLEELNKKIGKAVDKIKKELNERPELISKDNVEITPIPKDLPIRDYWRIDS